MFPRYAGGPGYRGFKAWFSITKETTTKETTTKETAKMKELAAEPDSLR